MVSIAAQVAPVVELARTLTRAGGFDRVAPGDRRAAMLSLYAAAKATAAALREVLRGRPGLRVMDALGDLAAREIQRELDPNPPSLDVIPLVELMHEYIAECRALAEIRPSTHIVVTLKSPAGWRCEECGTQLATLDDVFLVHRRSTGEWTIECSRHEDLSSYDVAGARFFCGGFELVDMLAHLSEKAWFEPQAFFECFVRLRSQRYGTYRVNRRPRQPQPGAPGDSTR